MDGRTEGLKSYLNKKVYIKLKNGRVYSGTVREIFDKSDKKIIDYVTIIDKFNRQISFILSEIALIEEENGKR